MALNPGLKPVNQSLLCSLAICFATFYFLLIIFVFISSWSDDQVMEAIGIKKTGLVSYELSLNGGDAVKLNSKQVEDILTFDDCRGLTEEQQEYVDGGYEKALDQFPTSLWFEEGTSSLISTWMVPILICFVVFVLVFHIFFLILLYKAYKSLQGLLALDSDRVKGMPTAGKSVGFLFIPLFNFYWAFKVFGKLKGYGEVFAAKTGLRYRGPSRVFGICVACSFVWDMLTRKMDFEYLSMFWMMDLGVTIFTAVFLPVMAFKLNAMVREFAPAVFEADESVSE